MSVAVAAYYRMLCQLVRFLPCALLSAFFLGLIHHI